jgi:hypothetical protein
MHVSSTDAPGKKRKHESFAAVSTVGFMSSPAIRCIVNPPRIMVGAPLACNGGHKDAGIPLDEEIVDTCHGLLPSSYNA